MNSPLSSKTFYSSGLCTLGLGLLLVFSAAACGDDSAPQGPPPNFNFNIEVLVVDQDSKPMAEVPVLLDDRTVGFTDREGKFEGQITEAPHTPIKISVSEVEGYRFTTKTSVEEPLRVQRGVSGEPQGLPVSLRVQAQSLVTNYLFWFKLECDEHVGKESCAGLPIRLGEEVVGHTDHAGTVYIAHRGVPGQKLRLTIDTPAHDPTDEDSRVFEPRQPTYEVELDFSATIYSFEEKFTDPVRAAAPPRRRVRPRPRPPAQTTSKAKEAPKKRTPPQEKKSGIIDLW